MKNNFLSKIVNKKIISFNRVCDLLSITISDLNEEEIFIHIQSFFRFLKDGKVLISSEDMYRCGKKSNLENFQWDKPGESLFDDTMKLNNDILFNSKIVSFNIENSGDLTVHFENDLILQIFVDTSESEEKYRIFDSQEEFVFYS